jgi:hypothetical protein
VVSQREPTWARKSESGVVGPDHAPAVCLDDSEVLSTPFFQSKKKRVYLPFDYVYCVCSTGFPICLLGIDPPVLLNAADGRGLR